jgi:aspartate/methionine/tyrosine aminotransferase
MCLVFEKDLLNHRQTLPIADPQMRRLVEHLTEENIEPDRRFVYYLLAAASICVVPLTSFSTDLQGFRFTLLEQDEAKFRKMIDTLSLNIRDYLKS